MRPRKKKNLDARFNKCISYLVENPTELKGHWSREGRPVYLEIGCGKGSFVVNMAKKYPDIEFVAMECIKDVLVMAMEKANSENIQNVRFINGFAQDLPEMFDDKEVSRIYINFSDPWPRKKQAKNRLTFVKYLNIYKQLLKEDSIVCQKTDNRQLFDYSIESFTENGWTLNNITFDLHNTENYAGHNTFASGTDVITEYENRFMDLGQPIHRLEASYCSFK